ncbi:MAG: response regulator [Vampirovibrionales bacterium]
MMTKVLVVDDSNVMRKVIIRELTKLGIEPSNITEAANGQEACDQVAAGKFDLILMDWNMPVMLGIDAVKQIRASGNKTPICMVTSEAEKSNVVLAIQSGANNYLVKPFVAESFQEKLAQLLAIPH